MLGSKVTYTFCIDFCKLFGLDNQRPNHETWEAMTLEEQQAFVASSLAPAPPAPTAEVLAANDAYVDSLKAIEADEMAAQTSPDQPSFPLGGNTPVVSDEQLESLKVSLPVETSGDAGLGEASDTPSDSAPDGNGSAAQSDSESSSNPS